MGNETPTVYEAIHGVLDAFATLVNGEEAIKSWMLKRAMRSDTGTADIRKWVAPSELPTREE